ncbi:sulfatase-like hydrolase/transferase [Flammeovirga kamogawensis]|uniref:Sulfatase-like hydrolase/transferase n=1 Tax=Flammeovirga kamogawensis TaxID=373891 RepID=A0ABX8H161_9BACT|nr:sulfatase-like hydrolase/transferase [Flammeovirga kamogawensis]MBB6462630.1 arylsulfatase A-like enzyme [Flammeovirga kamogawensis]QWG09625.1 sulfatase-like hydrolase/transferase [Flammeovirga kamogawensis]TRX65139.1 sulfatase-like hydrolase/transferase [Flammeovirga kamogawensis]
MNKRLFITFLVVFFTKNVFSQEKPNVLFIQTDQHVWYGLDFVDKGFDTPNLNTLAENGTYFSNAIVTTPSCSPARGTFVTGMYPHSNTIINNLVSKPNAKYKQHGVEKIEYQLTENILFDKGYFTGHYGKWHIGKKKVLKCYKGSLLEGQSHSYDANKNYKEKLAKEMAKINPKPSDQELWGYPLYQSKVFTEASGNTKWKHKGILATGETSIPVELLPHTSITNEAIRTVKAKKGQPWMITVSYHPPHIPWAMPEPYFSMYNREDMKVDMSESDKVHPNANNMDAQRLGRLVGEKGIKEYLAIYRSQVKYMDEEVGRIIQSLKETGQYENTLIIFTSDHGDIQGRFGAMGKSLDGFYDELVRVPLIVKAPNSTNKKMLKDKHQVSIIDIMPTILDYCGIEIPKQVQGASLKPLVNDKKIVWRKYNVCERTYPHKNDYVCRMITDSHYKYVFYSNGPDALYDLKKDPKELKNVIDNKKYKGKVEELKTALTEWMVESNDTYLAKYFEI